MEIRMSAAEVALLQAVLRKTKAYLEFGSGGSTYQAFKITPGPIVSVDSSQEWLDKVRQQIGETDRLNTHFVDIGPTGDWGYPVGDTHRESFPSYYTSAWNELPREQIDTVLVDGRFRVACFAAAVLRVTPTTRILIHDYRSRPQYHDAERIGIPIAEAEDLTVFIPKPGVAELAAEILKANSRNPG